MLRRQHETLQEQALREARAAGGIAGGTPLPGEPEEILGGPRFRRAGAAVALAIGLPTLIGLVGWRSDVPLPIYAVLAVAAGLAAFVYGVVHYLRFRLALDPVGIHRRLSIGEQVIRWEDFVGVTVTLHMDVSDWGSGEFGPALPRITCHRVLAVQTRGGEMAALAGSGRWGVAESEELDEWAEAITRWAEIYSPRQRQGA